MTFDELWRLDLARSRGHIDPAPDQPDEAEVNRFLAWLEKNSLFDSSDNVT